MALHGSCRDAFAGRTNNKCKLIDCKKCCTQSRENPMVGGNQVLIGRIEQVALDGKDSVAVAIACKES